jgi:Ubiquinone biosynthesis protein COQ7
MTSGERMVASFLRVNQAGELGAVRIYQGQHAVLGKGRHGTLLAHMAGQEQRHLDTFSRLIAERGVRPTALSPLWHVAGFVLGAGTALMGERAAMACTVAVEEAIDAHYAGQAARLGEDEAELKATIEEFRTEELEHRDIGLANGAEQAPAYPVLSAAIKSGCRLAIWLSERV